MKFVKVKSGKEAIPVLDRIAGELYAGKRVLWLLCGGSSIRTEGVILDALQHNAYADNLTLMLMDERYGPVGHPDSNWQQFLDLNIDLSNSKAIPVLTEPPKSLTETTAEYAQKVTAAFDNVDVVIGVFGLGADGHTAGILPGTAATVETDQSVVGYETPEFSRITLTKAALSRVDIACVLAFGESKAPALARLQQNQESFTALPSSLLYEIPDTTVYNDQIGEKI